MAKRGGAVCASQAGKGKERSGKKRREGRKVEVTMFCKSLQGLEIPSGCVVPADREPLACISTENWKPVFNTIPKLANN